jgi:prefoldin subunit 5
VASKIAERIESLEERLKQLKARQQRLESRRRSLESRRARREDTRRKILVGAVVLAKVDQEDRALFGLSVDR